MTGADDLIGSPSYMSPEQATSAASVTAATDIYALGATLYHLISGRPPFQAGTIAQTLDQVRSSEVVAPRELNPNIDPDLETICLKCLEKEPTRRYESAIDLADDLQRYRNHEPILARPIGMIGRLSRWTRRHPARASAFAASSVALLAFVGLSVAVSYQQTLDGANESLNEANTQLKETLGREQTANKGLKVAHDEIEKKSEQIDHLLYTNRVSLALMEWEKNAIARADARLAQCSPGRRNWEWHYVHRLCHTDLLTIKAHSELVTCVAFTPNSGQFITGSLDNTLKLWNVWTGEEEATFRGHSDGVTCVAVSPDSLRILSGSQDGTFRLWTMVGTNFPPNPNNFQKLIDQRAGHREGAINAVAFSPDSKRFITAGDDKTLMVWDTETHQHLMTLNGHSDRVTCVAFSHHGQWIVSGSDDNTLIQWDANTGKKMRTFGTTAESRRNRFVTEREKEEKVWHFTGVTNVGFSSDDQKIVSTDEGGAIQLTDLATANKIRSFRGHEDKVTRAVLTQNNIATRVMVTLGENTTYSRLSRGIRSRSFFGGTYLLNVMSGASIFSAGWDGTIRVWGEDPGRSVVIKGHTGRIHDLELSADGHSLVTTSGRPGEPSEVKVWKTETYQQFIGLSASNRSFATCMEFNSDGSRLIGCCSEKGFNVWDTENGRGIQPKRHTTENTSLSVSHDDEWVSTGAEDGSITLWHLNKSRDIAAHADVVEHVAMSPDGSRVASVSRDRTLKLWDVATGKQKWSIKNDAGFWTRVAFSADGEQLVAGSSDGVLTLWDAETGKQIKVLAGHSHPVSSVKFNSDGTRIVSSGGTIDRPGEIFLWDASTGAKVGSFDGHTNKVFCVAFAPDGKRIFSGSADGTIRVWDTQTEIETLSLSSRSGSVLEVTIDPTGRKIASRDEHGLIRIWDAGPGAAKKHKAADEL